MIPVVWATWNLDAPDRGYWDQAIVGQLTSGSRYQHVVGASALDDLEGCVLVVPGGTLKGDIHALNDAISHLEWCVLVVTSDEEATFPYSELKHPNIITWNQYGRPGHTDSERWLPLGATPHVLERVREHALTRVDRRCDWSFAGQVTHRRRQLMLQELLPLENERTELFVTEGFAQSFGSREDYADLLLETKIAPAPAGPVHPDSFRAWEAIECGAVPLVDGESDYVQDGYWHELIGPRSLPIVRDWSSVKDVISAELEQWPANANRVGSWWEVQKMELHRGLELDAGTLSSQRATGDNLLANAITVLIPTSPIPSHPSTEILEATIGSVRAQLPHSEVLVLLDGVRPEQEERRDQYERYQAQVLHLVRTRWSDVVPVRFMEHQHQARMARFALEHAVATSLVLFVEHDTPLEGEIPWRSLVRALALGDANLIRFHHEARVLEPHEYLMPSLERENVQGAPLIKCAQWSQRPHLARADYYQRVLCDYFNPQERWMIEDRMHSVLATAWLDRGLDGWAEHKTWMYAPDGSFVRSRHLDGREGDPKWVDC